MSLRARNKWHLGHAPEPDTSRAPGPQAADDDAFGAWLSNQRRNNPEAQRIFAEWQESQRPDEERATKSSPPAVIRRDVLPKETFVDVFNFSTRVDLDRWTTVSRKLHGGTESAQPLRRVNRVCLTYYREETGLNYCAPKRYEAAFYVEENGPAELIYIQPDFIDVRTPFFACLRFCYVETSVTLRKIRIDQAFVNDLKANNKDFRTGVGFPGCELFGVSFADDVDPYDAITSFPSFRRIAFTTLGSLVKHYGGPDDALLSSLAAHGIWNVWIPDEKVGASRITEDGILDFAFGDYEDDEEGRRLLIFPEVPLSPEFFEKLEKACRDRKSILKAEVLIKTHRAFDVGQWDPQRVARLNNYLLSKYEHRPISEFKFDGLPNLTVRYVAPDPHDNDKPCAVIHFWRSDAPTLSDRLLVTGPHYP